MPEVLIGNPAELRHEPVQCFEWLDRQFVLVYHDQTFFLLDNLCPHKAAALCDGDLINGAIACPWHKARFDLVSGQGLSPLAGDGVNSYQLREQDGQLLAQIPS